jgi:hypothetical protein
MGQRLMNWPLRHLRAARLVQAERLIVYSIGRLGQSNRVVHPWSLNDLGCFEPLFLLDFLYA